MLIQIVILSAVVISAAFLAPSFHSETVVESAYIGDSLLKKIDATDCSLIYLILQVGLNRRYTYISAPNGSTQVIWDWGWRLDSSTTVSTRPERHGVVNGTGTVEYIGVEGGFYGIVSDDGEHYDPRSLPQKFAVDGLRVSFSVRISENQGGVHMWGYIVDIVTIEKLQ